MTTSGWYAIKLTQTVSLLPSSLWTWVVLQVRVVFIGKKYLNKIRIRLDKVQKKPS